MLQCLPVTDKFMRSCCEARDKTGREKIMTWYQSLILPLAISVLRAIVQELGKRSKETKTPYDDMLIEILKSLIAMVDMGKLDIVMRGKGK